MAVRSFRSRALRRLFEAGDARGVKPQLLARVRDILFALDQAEKIAEMDVFPGWRLHALKGGYAGYWSVSVSGNWRIVFRFEDENAYDVDLIDYH